ncbi:flagellar hook protein FlgE [Methylobacterium sp. 1030]|uniref:flagellar hook protein FlgE n=1 Tax=Methylobacterium sp. 1030 TaxID=3156404 RepID=UPI0033977794
MSLYGVLRSGVSGMNAQSNRLGVVADNIQNQNTTGYKRSTTEFSSLLLESGSGSYNSGAVETTVRHSISSQGPVSYTTSDTDLAIQGNGFFVVTDTGGTPTLTRAGNFVVDGSTKDLVNAAGFRLMGYSLANGDPAMSLNSTEGLVPVNVAKLAMKATPSTTGTLSGNLPDSAAVVPAGQQPPGGSTYSKMRSLTTYDNVGNAVTLNLYLTKTGANEWQVAAYDASKPANFPGTPLAAPTMLTFDALGKLTTPATLNLTIPNGQPFTLDMAGMTQLAGDYTLAGGANGNKPSAVKGADVGADGTVYALYDDGTRLAAFRVPLATVASPDNLTPHAGNVFDTTIESGTIQLGFAKEGGRGSIQSGALEQSNVDIGTELTTMVEAQTAYTANSKVFQTGSEMLDVLMNLKR